MNKEPFTDKLIKRFYGITGPLDEYKRHEVDRIGNIGFIVLFYVLVLGNFLAILAAYHYPEQVALLYPIILTVVILLLSFYIVLKGKKAGVSHFEKEELSEKELKKLSYAGLKAGLFFGTGVYLMQGLLQWLIDQEPFLAVLTNWRTVIVAVLQGIFFGGFIHLIIKSRMKRRD
ncbi:DUF3278 domain-containing protein [Streptococcus ovuberis]|uniref:DUF3278 domain-containing protein n=1 Tax=Streptococcus ovuberis TaxID=1936207 RepID=A0A7X6S1I6_9STRE|nr:DUF3278 domain-containing protein [Streptococcus ovuberis]NKZ20852.1 DUF3278 domain-containing protein [Streptococcus ovuberis]